MAPLAVLHDSFMSIVRLFSRKSAVHRKAFSLAVYNWVPTWPRSQQNLDFYTSPLASVLPLETQGSPSLVISEIFFYKHKGRVEI